MPEILPSTVTNTSYMFNNATSFDQDISSWDVSNVTNMSWMFKSVTLSTTNYDSLLIKWSELPLQNGVDFHGGNSQFSSGAAEVARQKIIDDFGWTISDGGALSISPESNIVPQTSKLYQNYPNPFNPTTKIDFDLANDTKVNIAVYNSKGEYIQTLVNNEFAKAGRYSYDFDGSGLPSGVYFYELKTVDYNKKMKAILMK